MNWWLVVAAWYGVASGVTFVAYCLDKRAAARDRWRTSEKTLQLMALIGGWPGALAGQAMLRHKTRKLRFKLTLWGVIALHLAAWATMLALVRPWEA